MKTIKGYHGEWNMGSPGGWEYQRIAQILGRRAWDLIQDNVEVDVDLDFEHQQVNAVPGFSRMILRAHRKRHGNNPVHAVLLAETETLDVVLENKNFVDYLNSMDGVKASLAGPGHLSLVGGKVCCKGEEATVIFMDFNMNVLIKMAEVVDTRPIKEAIKQGILVNPRGMEPLGAKSLFEAITDAYRNQLNEETTSHTPWTRQFYPRSTTGHSGEPIMDLVTWTKENWENLVLKPAHGYSGHGIFVGFKERSAWTNQEKRSLILKTWQTDFRCFITDEGLQGFLARFGGVPTNVGSGGGIQPIAVLKSPIPPKRAVDLINQALLRLGYNAFSQIREEIDRRAIEMGFTYLLGPINIMPRPRLLTEGHIHELQRYAQSLWRDAVRLEGLWREGQLDDVIRIGGEEKELALSQPWLGNPALMVSDGLFSFGADLMHENE
jgi:hypothetical protein